MRISGLLLKGLAELYGPIGRRVWVYQNEMGSVRHLALRPEQKPVTPMPGWTDHQLVGELNLETGEVVEQATKPQRVVEVVENVVAIIGLALRAAGTFVGFALASMIIFLIALLGGGRHRSRW